ncbi:hypothetical protein IQ03_01949 [Gemmobacter caeni]|uniref:Uncharacterized protein n=1 Tax=Gemmobacter caeni TaxID=589035 RepID=A0A2T6B569_9RHOB|nr:hypothetical protein [Gemmobacter caeni]PTX51231.1 hypothetical protein C8N34_104352 [Gemmobacter caeni]TWJ01231.1 hypothetical protein IQ03_01949 [Gemmobacter caeni]
MTYTPQPSPPPRLGHWHQIIDPTAEKLRAYFRAGIPVIAAADGLTYRAERRLPDEHDTDE